MGLILLILLLIKALENIAMRTAKTNIGNNANGSKEKANPIDKACPTSKLATTDMTISSKEAITNERKHCIEECQNKNFLLSFLLTPKHLAKAISFLPSIT